MKDKKPVLPVLSEETQVIWNELKGLSTEFFGLNNITLGDILFPLSLDHKKLFLALKAPAALVSLENSLSTLLVKNQLLEVMPKYVVEQVKGMAVVSLNPDL